jgi:hypothetical protein
MYKVSTNLKFTLEIFSGVKIMFYFRSAKLILISFRLTKASSKHSCQTLQRFFSFKVEKNTIKRGFLLRRSEFQVRRDDPKKEKGLKDDAVKFSTRF